MNFNNILNCALTYSSSHVGLTGMSLGLFRHSSEFMQMAKVLRIVEDILVKGNYSFSGITTMFKDFTQIRFISTIYF